MLVVKNYYVHKLFTFLSVYADLTNVFEYQCERSFIFAFNFNRK